MSTPNLENQIHLSNVCRSQRRFRDCTAALWWSHENNLLDACHPGWNGGHQYCRRVASGSSGNVYAHPFQWLKDLTQTTFHESLDTATLLGEVKGPHSLSSKLESGKELLVHLLPGFLDLLSAHLRGFKPHAIDPSAEVREGSVSSIADLSDDPSHYLFRGELLAEDPLYPLFHFSRDFNGGKRGAPQNSFSSQ